MVGLHLVRGNHGSKTDTPPGDGWRREEGHTTKVHRDKAPSSLSGYPSHPLGNQLPGSPTLKVTTSAWHIAASTGAANQGESG